jgi:ribosome-interacting GTPase 1
LRVKRVTLTDRWEPEGGTAREVTDVDEDPFALRLPAVLLANRVDLLADVDTELRAFLELAEIRYPAIAVSPITGRSLGEIGSLLFRKLGIVRVYTKVPGRPPDQNRPFTLRRGQTVDDVAWLVHKDLARSLKYARVWGKSGFDGQHVGRDHPLADGDVVELHT